MRNEELGIGPAHPVTRYETHPPNKCTQRVPRTAHPSQMRQVPSFALLEARCRSHTIAEANNAKGGSSFSVASPRTDTR